MGTLVTPFRKRQGRQVISRAPKFYLFDVGVAGAIVKREVKEERGEAFGRAFEHFIFMELSAHRSYTELHYDINFWRTKHGVEVDFILGGGEVALEVKGSSRIESKDLRPLQAFIGEYKPAKAIVVCNEREERIAGPIRIMPYGLFLRNLWSGKIIH
jgi:predicted AAA+ superfamily ATPase